MSHQTQLASLVLLVLFEGLHIDLCSLEAIGKRGAEAEKDKMVLACSLCTLVYTLLFYFCRVKLKHFEKFQDTTEALAGK